jgi:hypothetical protein
MPCAVKCSDCADKDKRIEELEVEKRWWKETALRQNAGLSPTSYEELNRE